MTGISQPLTGEARIQPQAAASRATQVTPGPVARLQEAVFRSGKEVHLQAPQGRGWGVAERRGPERFRVPIKTEVSTVAAP